MITSCNYNTWFVLITIHTSFVADILTTIVKTFWRNVYRMHVNDCFVLSVPDECDVRFIGDLKTLHGNDVFNKSSQNTLSIPHTEIQVTIRLS